ncbi:MAG: fimbrillin family protein [Bacteroides sp.]|nr:fimbrillin family protein [Bacteroides sp.]
MKKYFYNVILISCILSHTACVNQIEEEIQESSTPITFSAKIKKTSTRVTENTFDQGDKIGLYAMLNNSTINSNRYIDNLELTLGSDNTFIPSRAVFYPEGSDNTLNFISYYPYQNTAVSPASSQLPITVYADQSTHSAYSQSDFMVARKGSVKSSSDPVALEFSHQLTKLNIVLVPGEGETATDMKKDNPSVFLTGCYTQAQYDLESGDISITTTDTPNLTSAGEWQVEDGKLTGKKFIIIPQNIDENQTLLIEWNGRVYNCLLPALATGATQGGMEYTIEVTATQAVSNYLTGVLGTIKDWENDGTVKDTDNQSEYAAVHIGTLSFKKSNVYQVHAGGRVIAEICKEYLISDELTDEAIVLYPTDEKGKSDLTKGIVLKLANHSEGICGGTISWDTTNNTFTYTEGTYTQVDKIYFDENYELKIENCDSPVNVNVVSNLLRDVRDGVYEYAIVKVGTQYWMRNNLRATAYRDGQALAKQTELGSGEAGYFYSEDYELYFYNGEALLGGELAPDGWRIPSENDWTLLDNYIGKDVSLIKYGTWEYLGKPEEGEEATVADVNNRTMLSLQPTGIWTGDSHANYGKMAGYWTWNGGDTPIPDKTIFLNGQDNVFLYDSTISSKGDFYKVLAIRCIKE